jgi:hypothetical protein
VTSIDILPDDVLLEIFDSYIGELREIEACRWQSLVHVCPRWRSLVFASPHRLKLHLSCTPETPARDTLEVWPVLPLLIQGHIPETSDVDDIVAVLEHRHRVCKIDLNVPSSQFEKVSTAMQEPIPKLTDLSLWSYDGAAAALSDSFLGGSAPSLRSLWLDGIPFPGLPKLHFSSTLVSLRLLTIPHSGYISPEAMVNCFSVLTSLESLRLEFQSPLSSPDPESRHLPPPTNVVLPALKDFQFKGVSEYLEELVACIDAPHLNYLFITFFNDIEFDTPELVHFIGRTPIFKAPDKARLVFLDSAVRVEFPLQPSGYGELNVGILCKELDWQLSSLVEVCSLLFPPLSTSKHLYIYERQPSLPDSQDDFENTQWLDILRPFIAVKNLYVSEQFAPRIALVLQKLVGGGVSEVLPKLQNIFLEELRPSGPVHEAIEQFVDARQLSGHSITVFHWEREW